jgi:bile acid:Na+ symporter, BASS family
MGRPSLVGILGRGVIGGLKIDRAKPHLKLANSANLLLLNYSNGSVSLPGVLVDPDWDFLAVTLGFALGLCVLAFASGWWLARLFRAEPDQRISLMFGLGMNNNGTGLVLASLALAHLPQVMLPILFYNLVQHLVAGGTSFLLCRSSSDPHSSILPHARTTAQSLQREDRLKGKNARRVG